MAIAITKTLQTVEYGLYCKSNVVFLMTGLVVLNIDVYQSSGHYTDGFVPIIKRTENITDSATVTSFASSYASTVGIAAAEAWLVANEAWYSGGSVV